ncbi:MAG: adenylate/guanylate cyclase domain-containing protein [Alphaproteobacteria bacterium]
MIRRIRLVTGLVLFVYILTHYLNHAVGLYSLRAAVEVEQFFSTVWSFPVAQILLYGSLVGHMLLALWALLIQRRLRDIRVFEAVQFILGFAVPLLILQHVVGTRGAQQLFDQPVDYVYVVLVFWVINPVNGALQAVALVTAWAHGCMGLHAWLRLKPGYYRYAPWLLSVALIIPMAALAGFASMGRELAAIAANEETFGRLLRRVVFPTEDQLVVLSQVQDWSLGAMGTLFAVTALGRVALFVRDRRRSRFRIHYSSGQRFEAPIGASILEVSQGQNLPHAHVCGGRGRCSTCRVRIGDGLEDLPPPSPDEKRVLDRIGAPPNVRLACQTHPTKDVAVTLLLPQTATAAAGHRAVAARQGQERAIAVLFADMRGFTAMSENRLPYDLVFILNRYFRAMGLAVEQAGGHLDKFIGDGVMALFGVEGDTGQGCRQALNAARLMAHNLRELNASLADELKMPIRVGIGINVGHAIVGEMGYATATGLTAIGDVVNTASRLEALTKEYRADLIVARTVADRAGLPVDGYVTAQVEIRGKTEVTEVVIVPNAGHLPELPVTPSAASAA